MESPDLVEREIRDVLRGVGLRATRARVAVYQVLKEVGGHRSVNEVSELVRARGDEIPRMSVYNVVGDLQAAGLVMCADTGPGRALYEVSDTWHHHFVCRVCSKIIDIACMKGEKPCLEPPESFGGTIDEAQIIFRGVCEDCL